MDCYDFYNVHGIHADSPWTPHGLSPWIPWTIPHGFYRILRDLIRIPMNVIKYNLIPLYYIYIYSEKKMQPLRLEPRTSRMKPHAQTH
jgi:hypothetical protein